MKKISFILALVLFTVGFTPAQANDQIIDQMVAKYKATAPCATNVDNLLLEVFKWDGGDNNYQDCEKYNYAKVMTYAVPTAVFTSKDYSIWTLKCLTHFFGYKCPNDKGYYNDNYYKDTMSSYYNFYLGNLKSMDTTVEGQLKEWNRIYKDYYISPKHNCKPLKSFSYTYPTGSYVATVTKSGNTYTARVGEEYKSGTYRYTKQEQKDHMDSCIGDWQREREYYYKMKEMFLEPFNIFSYAEGNPCFLPGKVFEFKGIGSLKCLSISSGGSVWRKI